MIHNEQVSFQKAALNIGFYYFSQYIIASIIIIIILFVIDPNLALNANLENLDSETLTKVQGYSNFFTYLFTFFVLLLLNFKYLKENVIDFFEPNLKKISKNLLYIIFGIVILIAINIFFNILYSILGITSNSANEDAINSILNSGGITLVMTKIVISVFAPFVEELIFRMSFIKLLDKLSKPVLSIVLSSFLFGLIHVIANIGTDWIFLPIYTGLGLVFGFIYYKTKNIFLCMLIHGLYNSI